MEQTQQAGSAGLVRTQYFTFAEPPNDLLLDSGERLGPITLAFETYGRLNASRTNAILVLHALSGDAHAAGLSADEGGISAVELGLDGAGQADAVSQTLQAVHRPDSVLREMLRVGRVGIVSFPNFGHWQIRWRLLTTGRMPKSDYLPFEWFDTPNIHLLTVQDFHDWCAAHGLAIDRAYYLTGGRQVSTLPNFLAKLAIFVVRNGD